MPLASAALLVAPLVRGQDPSQLEQRLGVLVQQGQLEDAARVAETAARERATAPSAYGWLGRISMAGARFEDAARHFSRARELGARVEDIADPWSKALVRLGRRDEACSLLGDASAADEENATLRYLTGACLLRLDEAREAVPHLEAALGNGLGHAAASFDLAEARFRIGREDLAADLLMEMTEAGSDPGTLLEVGKVLFRRVLYRHALAPLEKAWSERPGWYDAGMYLALAHYQLEEYEECVQVLSALPVESSPTELRILLGSALARLGRPEEARQELETAARLSPERADGYLNLGLFFLDHGRAGDARRAFERAATKHSQGAKVLYHVKARVNCRGLAPPANLDGGDPDQALFYRRFADTLLAGQQWGAALEVYLTALQIDPGQPRPYGGIGLICQELGTAEVGLAFVRRGLDLNPADQELHYFLGSLYDYLSKPMQAIASYQAALRLAKHGTAPARYWLRLGVAQLAAGRAADAEASIRRALGADPELAEAHYRLGRIRFSEGQYSRAESLFERAVDLDPSLDEAYYSWGLASIRTGKGEKGRAILDSHRRKSALRKANLSRIQ